MVFTSIPAYLDQAHWHQHPNNQAGPSNGHQLPPPPPQSPAAAPQPHGGGGGAAGSIRPGSMTDRARLANIPMPESALKCPRCESTNTKFCYFNNYNLTQPRHFCKTCKRYWTRGGALRNVPVGGSCRRNKRSKGSSSKSASVTADDRQRTSSSSSTISSKSYTSASTEILGLGTQFPPMRFMAPLHHMTDFGLNYGTTSAPLGGPSDLSWNGSGGAASFAAHGTTGFDQWRIQQAAPQFPFLGGLESSYQFETLGDGTYSDGSGHYVRAKVSSSVSTQMASLKMEGNNNHHHHHQELSLPRQFLGVPGNDEYWGTGHAWTDISSFSSSSTSNPL